MSELSESPEQKASNSPNGQGTPTSPHFRRSLSSANFSPNGDLYDSLDEEWLGSSETGELSIFEFLDAFSVIPETLDKINRHLKLQSRGVQCTSEVQANICFS
jgi:hypothetical protein